MELPGEISLITIGYWGTGKSTTANTLLGKDAFRKNNSTTGLETEPEAMVADNIRVVDGLCLWGRDPQNIDVDTLYDIQTAVEKSGGGFDAVLMVLKYGEQYTPDEDKVAAIAKKVLGPKVLEQYGICVFTRGDDFKYAVEEGEVHCRTFSDWCTTRSGQLKKLIQECDDRCALVDNKSGDPMEKENILSLVSQLMRQKDYKRYSLEDFCDKHGTIQLSPGKKLEKDIKRKLENRQQLKDAHDSGTTDSLLAASCDHVKAWNYVAAHADVYAHTDIDAHADVAAHGNAEAKNDVAADADVVVHADVDAHDNAVAKKDVESHAYDAVPVDIVSHADVDAWKDGEAQKMRQEDPVLLLMLGGPGKGKSSTGNSILGRRTFQINPSICASESCVAKERQDFDDFIVSVVDGPTLDSMALDNRACLNKMTESVQTSLDLCNYSFSGLLVILKFGERYTKQDKDVIAIVKIILGGDVLKKFGICVLTHGDHFDEEKKDEGRPEFLQWCKQQTGDIAELFQECSYRCVLFDNKTNNEKIKTKQRLALLNFVNTTQRYSVNEFVNATKAVSNLLLQCDKHILEERTYSVISEVRKNIEATGENVSPSDKQYKLNLIDEQKKLKEHKAFLGQYTTEDYLLQLMAPLERRISLMLWNHDNELMRMEHEKQYCDKTLVRCDLPSELNHGADNPGASSTEDTTKYFLMKKISDCWGWVSQKIGMKRNVLLKK